MKRTTISVDPELIDEAIAVSGASSRNEAIEWALQEMIRRRKLVKLSELAGQVELSLTQEELKAWREER